MLVQLGPTMSKHKLYFEELHDLEYRDLAIILSLIQLILFVDSEFVIVAAVVHL